MTKNEPIIYVSNIISGYNIARSYYTDILFQHGVDKIFYYGNALGDDDKDCSFIYYLPKQNGTFGLHKNDYQLYDPINIVNLGCEIYAHVDLNYDYYMTILNEKYKKTSVQQSFKSKKNTVAYVILEDKPRILKWYAPGFKRRMEKIYKS